LSAELASRAFFRSRLSAKVFPIASIGATLALGAVVLSAHL
jgi:hypothetical protein